MSLPLFDPRRATQPRQVLTWTVLAAAAGLVNGTALQACARFVTHVTGTVTRIGLDVGGVRLMLEYLLVLGCFVAGAAASVFLLQWRVLRGRAPAWTVALTTVAVVLCGIALVGSAGAFGAFGGQPEQPADFALLSLLSVAMGLQNATVTSATPIGVRTTHMTGPASDLGVHLGTAIVSAGDARAGALRLAAVRASKIFAFAAGAALSLPLVRYGQYLAFVAPAILVGLAATLSFRVKGETHDRASHLGGRSAQAA